MTGYFEYPPVGVLAPFVECGWVRHGTASGSLRVLPDGCVDVFVRTDGTAIVSGPASTYHDQSVAPAGVLAGLRLRPGTASAVLQHPVCELTDVQLELESVWGASASRWAEDVAAAVVPRAAVETLQAMVMHQLDATDPVLDRCVAQAIQMLNIPSAPSVSHIAATVGLSERQLRRRFDAAVGYGPKRLDRVMRFQRLLDAIRAGRHRHRWAELAVETGYADQSHMIDECWALAGQAPTSLADAAA